MAEQNVVIDPLVTEMLASYELSEKAKQFLTSDLGAYLIERAKNEADEALVGLAGCDPEDAKAIRGFQFKLRVSEAVVEWLGDVIVSGEAAAKALYDEE